MKQGSESYFIRESPVPQLQGIPSVGQALPKKLSTRPTLAEDMTSSSGWQLAVDMVTLISLGSLLILFPAWLPNNPGMPVEDGAGELLQLALLSLNAAFLLAASSHVGRFRPIYLGLSSATMAATVGKFSHALGAPSPNGSWPRWTGS